MLSLCVELIYRSTFYQMDFLTVFFYIVKSSIFNPCSNSNSKYKSRRILGPTNCKSANFGFLFEIDKDRFLSSGIKCLKSHNTLMKWKFKLEAFAWRTFRYAKVIHFWSLIWVIPIFRIDLTAFTKIVWKRQPNDERCLSQVRPPHPRQPPRHHQVQISSSLFRYHHQSLTVRLIRKISSTS